MNRFCDNPKCEFYKSNIEDSTDVIECLDDSGGIFYTVSSVWEGEFDDKMRFCTECFERVLDYGIENVIENYYDKIEQIRL